MLPLTLPFYEHLILSDSFQSLFLCAVMGAYGYKRLRLERTSKNIQLRIAVSTVLSADSALNSHRSQSTSLRSFDANKVDEELEMNYNIKQAL